MIIMIMHYSSHLKFYHLLTPMNGITKSFAIIIAYDLYCNGLNVKIAFKNSYMKRYYLIIAWGTFYSLRAVY